MNKVEFYHIGTLLAAVRGLNRMLITRFLNYLP